VTLPSGYLEKTEAVMGLLAHLWKERCSGPSFDTRMDWVGQSAKTFLRNCLLRTDFEQYPELTDWIFQDKLLTLAALYFGHAAMLGGVRLWWSPINSSMESSQLFHLDQEDSRMLRVFLNVSDVTEQCGPFTFIPAPESQEISKAYGVGFGRLRDEDVFSLVDPTKLVQLTGPAGSVHLVDPARCLHYGSRGCQKDRVLFMLHFVPVPVHIEPTGWIPHIKEERYRDRPLAKLAMPDRYAGGNKRYSPRGD
jgi:hypothetical protein